MTTAKDIMHSRAQLDPRPRDARPRRPADARAQRGRAARLRQRRARTGWSASSPTATSSSAAWPRGTTRRRSPRANCARARRAGSTRAPDVDAVLEEMQSHRIRRLPVVENKRLVGMISEADLARHLPTSRSRAGPRRSTPAPEPPPGAPRHRAGPVGCRGAARVPDEGTVRNMSEMPSRRTVLGSSFALAGAAALATRAHAAPLRATSPARAADTYVAPGGPEVAAAEKKRGRRPAPRGEAHGHASQRSTSAAARSGPGRTATGSPARRSASPRATPSPSPSPTTSRRPRPCTGTASPCATTWTASPASPSRRSSRAPTSPTASRCRTRGRTGSIRTPAPSRTAACTHR